MEKIQANQSAFSTTFQGKPQEETQNPKKKECLCGEQHLYRDCPYLLRERQPAGWKPDPAIQERINKKLQNPRLKAAVDHARASQKEEKKDTPEIQEEIYEEGTF
jgi:hypothetical protein